VWERERMPQVEGIEIVGSHAEADGIEFVQVMQPTLHGVLIREVRHGIRLSKRNRNVLISACHIYNCRGVGVLFDRVDLHQAIIQGSHISYCKGGGIKIVGGAIRNFQITGNDIEYNYDPAAAESADIWFDLREGSVAEGTIASNTIQAQASPGGANIRFIGPERPVQRGLMGLWSISGNLIGNQEVNIHLKNSRGIAITGNHIYTGRERNLLIEESRHIVISGNSFDQSHNYRGGFTNGITLRDCDGINVQGLVLDRAQGGDAAGGGAIEVLNCRETILTGCQIFEPRFRGIYVSDSRNTTITGCQIMAREPGTMLSAVHVAGNSRGLLIEGNILGHGREGDLIVPPGVSTRGNQAPAQ
jgi:parallel beta-helix repeat protein